MKRRLTHRHWGWNHALLVLADTVAQGSARMRNHRLTSLILEIRLQLVSSVLADLRELGLQLLLTHLLAW